MTTIIQTTEKTFNKKVKAQILELTPTAKKIKKTHIAGCGYVFFIKDENNKTLCKVLREPKKGMKIYINN